ncbi:hypothetical protein ABIF61_002684 [Bradyrhizobium japonicum]
MVQNIASISTREASAPARRQVSACRPIAPRMKTSGVANAIWVGISSAMKTGRKSSIFARPSCFANETH